MRVRRLTRFRAVRNRRGGAVSSGPTWSFGFGGLCLIFFLVVFAALVCVPLLIHWRNRAALKAHRNAGREGSIAWALPAPARHLAPAPVAADCPVCGTALPADSPMGLCPQCLMQCALSRSDHAGEAGEP